jgi:hypothetical protein
MATNTFVELNLPEAADVADLTGVHYDLESAKDLALKLRAMVSAGRTCDFSLVDALSTAILVRYSRAFVKGVRRPLQQDALHELSDSQRTNREYFIPLRHKHIAHSVNSFEESTPVARYWVERVETEGITSIECNHHLVMGSKDLDALVELIDVLLQFVDKRIAEEKKRLLAIVRAMPLAVVISGAGRVTVLARGPVNKSRKR